MHTHCMQLALIQLSVHRLVLGYYLPPLPMLILFLVPVPSPQLLSWPIPVYVPAIAIDKCEVRQESFERFSSFATLAGIHN